MSVPDTGAGESVPFVEALRRMWVAHPTATVRNVFLALGCLALVALQVALVAVADNRWALLGVVCLPVAAWLLLAGFVRQRQGVRALGLVLVVVGVFLPFYLDSW